uniref:Integrase catalytic domain-containing protein n=1 Tax=Cannabis sativa TaxID=3483 RepID=A0A803NKF3_CANSA
MVVVDYVSKWVEAIASPTNDAKVVMKFLHKNVFTRFGTPRALISDEGTHFVNKVLAALLAKYIVKHKIAKAYHPQINGQAKISNRELTGILEKVVNPSSKDLSQRLHDSLWAYQLEHKAIWALKNLNLDLLVAGEARKLRLFEIDELRLFAYENSKLYKEKMKKWRDGRIKERVLVKNQQVLLFNSRLKLFPGKLKSHWSGPFAVTEVYPFGAILVEDEKLGREFKTAENKYHNKVDNQQFYMERGLVANVEDINELPELVSEIVRVRHWELFVKKQERAVMEVVKEFYTNFLSQEWPTEVIVREVLVSFSAKAINNLFGLTSVACSYTSLKGQVSDETLYDMIAQLAKPESEWDLDDSGNLRFRQTEFEPDMKCLYTFVQTSLCPTSHDYTVSRDHTWMLHCIKKGMPVDVGAVVAQDIADCAHRGKGKLFLPSTITALCREAGVSMWVEEGALHPRGPISFGPPRAPKTIPAFASTLATEPPVDRFAHFEQV